MDKSYIKKIITPEETIKGDSGVEIQVRGVDFAYEQWVLKPKLNYDTLSDEQKELADNVVFSRMVRACVKKVSGVGVEISGQTMDISELLEYDTNGIMTENSYNLLMRALNQDPSLVQKLLEFYQSATDSSKYIVKKK